MVFAQFLTLFPYSFLFLLTQEENSKKSMILACAVTTPVFLLCVKMTSCTKKLVSLELTCE